MNGDIDEPDETNDEDNAVADAVADGDIVVDTDDDNVGDLSVEINVEELVANIESTDAGEIAKKAKLRKRLDKIREQQRQDDELDSTYNFNLDDDV